MASTTEHLNLFNYLKDSLTKFQKTLHNPEDESKGPDYEGNQIPTLFNYEYMKSTWYFQFPEIMQVRDDGANVSGEGTQTLIFKAKAKTHGLLYSDLCQRFPSIRCKPGYRAKWTFNSGINIIKSGELVLSDTTLQSIEYISSDINKNSMNTEPIKEIIDMNVGNIPYLQTFSEVLPEFSTSYFPDFYYSKDPSCFFPLFLCGFLDSVEHKLVLRRKLSDFLTVVDNRGVKVEITTDTVAFVGGHSLNEINSHLPKPEMWGQYLYLTDAECEFNREKCSIRSPGSLGGNEYYIEDTLQYSSPNPSKLGNTVTVEIKNTEYPVIRFAWVAQNGKALKNKNYNNYSTNFEDFTSGWSPIESSSLSAGKSYIFKDMPSFRTERVYPQKQYPSTPRVPGINLWNNAVNVSSTKSHPGIVIKDGALEVKLKDTNPYVQCNNDALCDDEFKVHLFVTYIKKICFDKFPATEKMRSIHRVEISIKGNEN